MPQPQHRLPRQNDVKRFTIRAEFALMFKGFVGNQVDLAWTDGGVGANVQTAKIYSSARCFPGKHESIHVVAFFLRRVMRWQNSQIRFSVNGSHFSQTVFELYVFAKFH